jgi:ribosomal protein S21
MRRDNKPQTYNFDRLLRTFRTKVKNSGKLEKIREKEYYEKPAQRKQRVKNAAIRREAKRIRDERQPPQRGFGSKSAKR